jgi:hypothetical protein
MNQSEENLYTLAQAFEKARQTLSNGEEPQILYGPGLDQALPANLSLGKPIPAGVVVTQPVSPDQPKLARKPIERDPTTEEERAFNAIWAAIDATAVSTNTTTSETNDQYWGFVQSPESLSRLQQLPEGVFRFEDAVRQPWCRDSYKTRSRLIKFLLNRYQYPDRILEYDLITKSGFAILQERKARTKYERDLEHKRKPKRKNSRVRKKNTGRQSSPRANRKPKIGTVKPPA